MTAMLCTMVGDIKLLAWNAISKRFVLISRNLLKMMYFSFSHKYLSDLDDLLVHNYNPFWDTGTHCISLYIRFYSCTRQLNNKNNHIIADAAACVSRFKWNVGETCETGLHLTSWEQQICIYLKNGFIALFKQPLEGKHEPCQSSIMLICWGCYFEG